MPAIRGCYTIHPQTGASGIWIELSTSPVGTLTGSAFSNWPAVGAQTLTQYQTTINTMYQNMCNLSGLAQPFIFGQQPPLGWIVSGNTIVPAVVIPNIVLFNHNPIVLSGVSINEGVIRNVRL